METHTTQVYKVLSNQLYR